jgi:hypothetical protein
MTIRSRARSAVAAGIACTHLFFVIAAQASPTCPDEQSTPQLPTPDQVKNICEKYKDDVRTPSKFRLDVYEGMLSLYLGAMCHRNAAEGWVRDKRVRDAGPWVGMYRDGKWTGRGFGTHAPVLIWYSKEMYAWLKENRQDSLGASGVAAPKDEAPVPDGAMMIKEMYPYPAAACAGIDVTYLLPLSQASAVMVRDIKGSHDGWFWGWYGWGPTSSSGWAVDWPAPQTAPYPRMGFGQYCTNCHASAKDNKTFAALNNIEGEPLVFLSQNFFLDPSWKSLQARINSAGNNTTTTTVTDPPPYIAAFTKTFWSLGGMPKTSADFLMPPETYDNVWARHGDPTFKDQYLTSDQCIGCHSAGGTGLQYDMTQPGPDGKLINISPYGTWRGSPMGLAGRDPIFFAQLASETGKFHPNKKSFVDDTCLGCHGILGQRQQGIDTKAQGGPCEPFARSTVDVIPWSKNKDDPVSALANYGSLARDGISCMSCHHMILGKEQSDKVRDLPQNVCVDERQKALNPKFTDFASTFTGSFLVGAPNELFGPFKEPKKEPMKHAMGIDPVHDGKTITSSELCGSCHTVHLPILHKDKTIGHVYEQTTYPEWAFSDFRTGGSPDGELPYGSGPRAQSCQGCHMPNKDVSGNPYRSKIAAIQEYSNFPQSEHSLPPDKIDLPIREGFGQHTLVGLNVYLLKMAWQFPDVLGIRTQDPMLTDMGIDSIPAAEYAMLDQAVNRTATVTVGDVQTHGGTLSARVTVISKVGHKFPSGVGFRRAFLEFNVLDVNNKVLWSSGKTDESGVIIDENKKPIDGELWWQPDCSGPLTPPLERVHQPHYKEITRQDQAQIYQELVAAPPDVPVTSDVAGLCGPKAEPRGPLTTSFLSICAKVKDNRILPLGFLPLSQRIEISKKLGADELMAEEAGAAGVDNDPDYERGGSDSLVYKVPLTQLVGTAAAVQATLYYQPTPPFFLQDRFCTSDSNDTKRLYYVAGKLNLAGTAAENWKLRVVTSGPVSVP